MSIAAGQRWQHIKRGTTYEVIGVGELQMSADLVDGSSLVIYRGDGGKLWAREEGEFLDGRFEPVSDRYKFDPRMTTPDAPVTVEQLVKAAADAHSAFVTARQRMNAATPALDATPAERAVYDERYRADHAAEREHWRTAIELGQNAHRLAALASAPAVKLDRDFTARRIKELMDEGDGFWTACSGCQESCDGYVSERDYPFDPLFRCQPGGGCSECGGIGVLWDDGRGYGDITGNEEPASAPAGPKSKRDTAIEALRDYLTSAGVPRTEFDPEFAVRMMGAMMVSFHKYGRVADAYPVKFDARSDVRARMRKYQETGNKHYLVDAANFAMIEAMHPARPDATWGENSAADSPGRTTADGHRLVQEANDGSRIMGETILHNPGDHA